MALDFKFPDVGEGIHEGKVVKVLVKEGDTVKVDQPLLDMETDKAVVELPSPAAGKIVKVHHKEGETVNVGEVLVTIAQEGESTIDEKHPVQKAVEKLVQAVVSPVTQKPSTPSASEPVEKYAHILAAPSTRKLARELNVNLELVNGTGPDGRIQPEDVQSFASNKVTTRDGPSVKIKEEKIVVSAQEGETRIPLSGLRKVIADRMTYSKTHIPDAVGMDLANVGKLVELREREKDKAAKAGVHLTYLPFIIKATVIALKKFPKFNSHFDESKQEIVMKSRFNISIAVDTEDGLMAPVIKDADNKSIMDIAKEIDSLATLARSRKIALDDMQGGTFTITNVGSVGAMFSVPIINPPQVAIMGIHRIKDMPIVQDGKVVPGKVMGISLAFDHRVADGAEATLFMNEIIRHIEDPDLLLIDMF